MLHKIIAVLIMILFFSWGGCSSQNKTGGKIEGFWGNIIDDDFGVQKFVYSISRDEDNNLAGVVHSWHNDVKYPPMVLGEITIDGDEVSIVSNIEMDIILKGEVDFGAGLFKGELEYADGSSMPMELERYAPDYISKYFPGLSEETKNLYKKPGVIDDGIIAGDIREYGYSLKDIEELIGFVKNGDLGDIHSFLVMKEGKLIVEKYFQGFWYDDLHPMHSVTKSVTSLLTGICFDRGYLNSTEQKVVSFFPENKGTFGRGWKDINLFHLLTMTAGVDWRDGLDQTIHESGKIIIDETLSRNIIHNPGEKFEYKNPNVDLFAGIIKKASGEHADQIAEKYLFKPLGINKYRWDYGRQNGYPLMDGSLAITPRDMIKMGLLVLNKGEYKGSKVISGDWIKEMVKDRMDVDEYFRYGFLWWKNKRNKERDYEAVFANGLGSQLIIILPESQVVIVTTGANYDIRKHVECLEQINQKIIPLFN